MIKTLLTFHNTKTQRHSKTITTKKHDRFSQDTKTPTKTQKQHGYHTKQRTCTTIRQSADDRVLTQQKDNKQEKKHRRRRCRRNSKQELSKTTQSCMSTLHTRGQNVPYKVQSNSDIAYLGYCVPSLCTYQMRMTDFELHLTLYIFTPVMRTWLVRTFAYCAQNMMHQTALHSDSAYM